MTTRVKLICHGSTPAVRASAFPNDESLEPAALQKLTDSAYRLGGLDRILASPAPAAWQTAEALGLSATAETALRECDYGLWAGRSMAAVHDEAPEDLALWLTDLGSHPHGGESLLSLMHRVGAWLDAQHGFTGVVAAVTHASVIRAAIVHALGAPPSSFWRIDVAPLALTKLSGGGGGWSLASIGPMAPRPRER